MRWSIETIFRLNPVYNLFFLQVCLVLSYDGCGSESNSQGEEAEGNRRESYAPGRVVEEESGDGDEG